MQHSTGTRSTASAVHFARPFRLGRDERMLPPGIYALHTHEDVYQGTSEPIYVVSSVELLVEEPGRTSSRIVRPADWTAALARDAVAPAFADDPSENPDRGRCDPLPRSASHPRQ